MRTKSLLLILLFATPLVNCAQKTSKPKQLPSVAIGAGVLSFNGDVGQGAGLSSFSRIRGGYSLTIEERIGKWMGVSLNGIYGKLADSERSKERNLNFESQIIQGDLDLVLHFDNDKIMPRNSIFAPYIFAGIGYLKFDPHGDLKDKNDSTYFYWSDGT